VDVDKNKNKKFGEELIAYFPFIWHGPQKITCPTILLLMCVCVFIAGGGGLFIESLPSNNEHKGKVG
jgi:hypothetical protein